MVLYHCCVGLQLAEKIARDGFPLSERIGVTEHPPQKDASDPDEFAVVMLSAPSDFRFEDYPLQLDRKRKLVRQIPAAVLNHFQRESGPCEPGSNYRFERHRCDYPFAFRPSQVSAPGTCFEPPTQQRYGPARHHRQASSESACRLKSARSLCRREVRRYLCNAVKSCSHCW